MTTMGDGMGDEKGYVQVKVYAVRPGEKLVQLPDGASGIINDDGAWIYGPMPLQWSKHMLKVTLGEWPKDTWTKSGEAFVAAAA